MSNFNKIIINKLTQYPKDILLGLSSEERNELAEEAMRNRDYNGLNIIVGYADWDCGSISEEAISRLDIEAVKIVSRCKGFKVQSILDDLFGEFKSLHAFLLGDEEAKKRRIEIFKFLMESNSYIQKEELELLAASVTKEEFEAFCNRKGIDLSDEEYQDINIPQYKLIDETPVSVIKVGTNPTIVDVILSKTYSKEIGQEKLRRLYENLLKLDQISKDMLSYLALQIIKGDSIKIQFSGEVVSAYAPIRNIISINSHVLEKEEELAASMIINEMVGYYVYGHLSKSNTSLISKLLRDQLHKSMKEGASEFIDDGFSELTHILVLFNNTTTIAELKSTVALLERYEAAVNKPIYEAAKLLKFDTTAMAKYKISSETANYFRHRSIIDIFYTPAVVYSYDELRTDVLKCLLNIYFTFAHQVQPISGEISQDSLQEWARTVFRPKVVEELQLTPKQILFLESIAAYINYKDKGNDSNNEYEDHIIRLMNDYVKLKAVGLDQEILDSFNDLVVLHQEQAAPLIKQELEFYKEQCDQCSSSFIQEQAQQPCFEFVCISDLV
jgi:hypothetical protein